MKKALELKDYDLVIKKAGAKKKPLYGLKPEKLIHLLTPYSIQKSHLDLASHAIFLEDQKVDLIELSLNLKFSYLNALFFDDLKLLGEVASKGLNAEKDEESLELGQRFYEKITTSYFAPSKVAFVDERVGYGLFANKNVKKGEFIGEYTGKVSRYEIGTFSDYLYRYPINDQIDRPYVIDAKNGNVLRFANHSSQFNMKAHTAYIEPFFHTIFIATRSIKAGEQFLYDYGKKYWTLRGRPKDLNAF